MFEVSIEPRWTIRRTDGQALSERTIALLLAVAEHGSLLKACAAIGVSYRHAWSLIREAEALLGLPLLLMERGKGSRLSPLAEKLAWADRRIAARLSPTLDSLASELEAELERVGQRSTELLRIRASHGFAIEAMHHALNRLGVPSALHYCSSGDAVAALAQGNCDVAGFHIPTGDLEAAALELYRPWFRPGQRLITLARRRVGLMVAAGDPHKIYDVADLARPELRFINRQPGSGTRFQLEQLLLRAGIRPDQVHGWEQCELTHAAVAAYVASGMADVGFGVETPARRFGLDFLPLHSERYFLLCDQASLNSGPLQVLLQLLAGPAFAAAIDHLPGYQADQPGTILTLEQAFPQLAENRAARARRS